MEQAAAHPLDPNMPTYGGPDPRHPHGLWWKQEPWTSTSTTDPEMALGGSPGPDATMASGGKQVSHSPFLVAFASLHPPLSTGRERLCLFFPAIPLHMFAHSMPGLLPLPRTNCPDGHFFVHLHRSVLSVCILIGIEFFFSHEMMWMEPPRIKPPSDCGSNMPSLQSTFDLLYLVCL